MTAHVLIADDNHPNCELLEAYLSDGDFRVSFAYDGPETLAAVEAEVPDVILLDIMMPKFSGYEVCARLRADERTARTPVLMISALDEAGDIDKAVQSGCDDFLTKPINSRELKICVKAALSLREAESETDRFLEYVRRVEEHSEALRV